MSYFVYVIKSETHGTRYIGSTAYVPLRVQEHKAGHCRYTSGRRPWRLVHQETLSTRSEARKREIFLKSGKGREELGRIL